MVSPPFSSDPVFICGDNRSGTTLLAIILDSHPDLVVGPELDFREPANLGPELLRCLDLLAAGDPRTQGRGVEAAPPFAFAVQFIKQCHRFGIEFDELGELVRRTMAATNTELVEFIDRCALLDAIGERRKACTGVARWGLKIQRELLHHRDYAALWPRASFVHVVRDGRDVAASHLRSERHLYYTSIGHAAHGWAELIHGTRALVEQRRVVELRYEDLVHEPEATLRPVLADLELAWTDTVLDHASAPHALLDHPYDHPSVEAVRRPVHAGAVGRFHTDLSADELHRFEEIAGEWLVRMRYKLATES